MSRLVRLLLRGCSSLTEWALDTLVLDTSCVLRTIVSSKTGHCENLVNFLLCKQHKPWYRGTMQYIFEYSNIFMTYLLSSLWSQYKKRKLTAYAHAQRVWFYRISGRTITDKMGLQETRGTCHLSNITNKLLSFKWYNIDTPDKNI